jgi:hypothetical protein
MAENNRFVAFVCRKGFDAKQINILGEGSRSHLP